MEAKRKWWRLPLILALILMIVFLGIRLCKGLWVRILLDRAWNQEKMVIHLHTESPVDYDKASLSWDTVGEARMFTLNLGQESIYLRKHDLYFSNGKGYALNGLLEELPVTGDQLRSILIYLPWERYQDAGHTVWKLTVPEEPGFPIRTLVPQAEQYWPQLRSLKLSLYEKSGDLQSIFFQNDTLSVHLELQNSKPSPIPTDLLMQMGNAPLPDIRTLEPLFQACQELNHSETVSGELNIQVDCGPLPIQDTARILLSEDGLSLGRGDQWTALTPDSAKREEFLLGLGWILLREGAWVPADPNGGTMRLTLKAEDIYTSLLTVLPELEGLNLTLDDGEMAIVIADHHLDGMNLICSGKLPFLFAEIPLSIRLELSLTE